VLGLACALLMPSTRGELNAVEDWSRHAVARRAFSGWRPYETFGGRPAYDFSVVNDEGRRALHLKSRDEHSTIAKEIHVTLRATPVLEWSWKVVQHPAGADIAGARARSDRTRLRGVAAFPGPLRTRLIGYAWDASLPAGSMERSRRPGASYSSSFIGTQEARPMGDRRRNVYEDYRKAFGEDPRIRARRYFHRYQRHALDGRGPGGPDRIRSARRGPPSAATSSLHSSLPRT